MRNRRLTLQRETLSALSTDDLANVAGAADHTTPLLYCVISPVCPAIQESVLPCHTRPCTS